MQNTWCTSNGFMQTTDAMVGPIVAVLLEIQWTRAVAVENITQMIEISTVVNPPRLESHSFHVNAIRNSPLGVEEGFDKPGRNCEGSNLHDIAPFPINCVPNYSVDSATYRRPDNFEPVSGQSYLHTMLAFAFTGLPLTHSFSSSVVSTAKCPPGAYHVLRRPMRTLPAPVPRDEGTIVCQTTEQPKGPLKVLAYAAAAVILASTSVTPFLSPQPTNAAPINSAPLRFQQSMIQDDGEGPVKLQAQWDVKSINSQTETFLMFSNDSSSVVDLWWIDYFGHEVYYGSISPGTTHMQPSYVTHPWVVRDHISQNSVLVLVAGSQPALAVVDSL